MPDNNFPESLVDAAWDVKEGNLLPEYMVPRAVTVAVLRALADAYATDTPIAGTGTLNRWADQLEGKR